MLCLTKRDVHTWINSLLQDLHFYFAFHIGLLDLCRRYSSEKFPGEGVKTVTRYTYGYKGKGKRALQGCNFILTPLKNLGLFFLVEGT